MPIQETSSNIPSEAVEIAPAVPEVPSKEFPWQWIFFAISAVIFIIAIAALIIFWRQPETRSAGGQGGGARIASPSPVAVKRSALSLANTDVLIGKTIAWENPALGPWCFASGAAVCQTVLRWPDFAQTRRVVIESRILNAEQQKVAAAYAYGRALAGQNMVAEYFRQSLLAGIEPQPYLKFVEDVMLAAKEHSLNPGFLLVVYDQIFTKAQEIGAGEGLSSLVTDFTPEKLASEYVNTLQALELQEDAYGKEVRALEWEPGAQALAIVLGHSLKPELVDALFAEGRLEQRYYEYLAPEVLQGEKRVEFSSAPASLQDVYAGVVDEDGEVAQIALCHEKKAFMCSPKDSSSLVCSPFDFLTYYCGSIPTL